MILFNFPDVLLIIILFFPFEHILRLWFLFIPFDIFIVSIFSLPLIFSIFVNYFNSSMSYQFWITRMIWYLRFHGLLLGSDVYLLRFYFDNMIFNLSRFIFSIWYFRLLWFYLNFMIYSAISILFKSYDIFYLLIYLVGVIFWHF